MAKPYIDLTGQRFGKLLVLRRSPDTRAHKSTWIVRCDCGAPEKEIQSGNLRSGRTNSCGCTWRKPRVLTPDEVEAKRRARIAYNVEYRAKNREALRAWEHRYRLSNRERVREYYLKQYGITRADFDALLASQGSVCGICGQNWSGTTTKDWHVDHCHETGYVRGVLCHHCNIALGHFDDRPELLERAASYLRKAEEPARQHAANGGFRPKVRVRNRGRQPSIS